MTDTPNLAYVSFHFDTPADAVPIVDAPWGRRVGVVPTSLEVVRWSDGEITASVRGPAYRLDGTRGRHWRGLSWRTRMTGSDGRRPIVEAPAWVRAAVAHVQEILP